MSGQALEAPADGDFELVRFGVGTAVLPGQREVLRRLPHAGQGHGGSCDPQAKVLTINDDQAINARVDVGCHELAHALVRLDRRDEDPSLGYAEEELVAESVAHLAVKLGCR